MAEIAVIYASWHGQARRIALRLAQRLSSAGAKPTLHDARRCPSDFSLAGVSAAIICGSIHQGTHEKELVHFVRDHHAALSAIPATFVSVSLTAADLPAPDARAETDRMIDRFIEETGWQPVRQVAVAGALVYREYGFVVRWMMTRAAREHGQSTDTSRDHELTDWTVVDRVAADVLVDSLAEMVCLESRPNMEEVR